MALNCVANGRLLRSGLFDGIWVQPAAGDAGGALGAALAGAMELGATRKGERKTTPSSPTSARSPQANSLLGPAFDDAAVVAALNAFGLVATGPLDDEKR